MAPKKRTRPSKRIPFSLITFALGMALGYQGHQYMNQEGIKGQLEEEPITIDVRFSPKGGGEALALRAILQAQEQILVHTYSFTSHPITEALIAAKRRGVNVRVLTDQRESRSRYCRLKELVYAGIEVRIDKVAGLAHNKVLIIDDSYVTTGSFNWSAAAEKRNAENILLIKSKKLNHIYTQNWKVRYRQSLPF